MSLMVRDRKGKKVRTFEPIIASNDTFALHGDLNLPPGSGRLNVTHRPTGYSVFGDSLSPADARDAFDKLTEHHVQTQAWAFTSANRMPKVAREFGLALKATYDKPAMEARS